MLIEIWWMSQVWGCTVWQRDNTRCHVLTYISDSTTSICILFLFLSLTVWVIENKESTYEWCFFVLFWISDCFLGEDLVGDIWGQYISYVSERKSCVCRTKYEDWNSGWAVKTTFSKFSANTRDLPWKPVESSIDVVQRKQSSTAVRQDGHFPIRALQINKCTCLSRLWDAEKTVRARGIDERDKHHQ